MPSAKEYTKTKAFYTQDEIATEVRAHCKTQQSFLPRNDVGLMFAREHHSATPIERHLAQKKETVSTPIQSPFFFQKKLSA